MGSESYHEPYEALSPSLRDMHRALWSLIEELEAIDWYAQRAEICGDEELRNVLLHNRGEEIEHAMMNLEWIRRHDKAFDGNIRTYLLKNEPITEIEESVDGGSGGEANGTSRQMTKAGSVSPRGLGVGSLRRG